jgi:hypothetical protein
MLRSGRVAVLDLDALLLAAHAQVGLALVHDRIPRLGLVRGTVTFLIPSRVSLIGLGLSVFITPPQHPQVRLGNAWKTSP